MENVHICIMSKVLKKHTELLSAQPQSAVVSQSLSNLTSGLFIDLGSQKIKNLSVVYSLTNQRAID